MTDSKREPGGNSAGADTRKETPQPQKQPSGEKAKPGKRGDQSRDPQGGRI